MCDMKKKASDKAEYVTVRIPRALYDEVEQLLPVIAADPVARASGRVSVSLALRLTLLRGIAVVRRELKDRKDDVAA